MGARAFMSKSSTPTSSTIKSSLESLLGAPFASLSSTSLAHSPMALPLPCEACIIESNSSEVSFVLIENARRSRPFSRLPEGSWESPKSGILPPFSHVNVGISADTVPAQLACIQFVSIWNPRFLGSNLSGVECHSSAGAQHRALKARRNGASLHPKGAALPDASRHGEADYEASPIHCVQGET